jgi:hypothetical protein
MITPLFATALPQQFSLLAALGDFLFPHSRVHCSRSGKHLFLIPVNFRHFVIHLTRRLHIIGNFHLQNRNMCYNIKECARFWPHDAMTMA